MSFGNTITITVNAVAKVLNRTGSAGDHGSQFTLYGTLDEYVLSIRHSRIKRGSVYFDRHNVELVHTIYAAGAVPERTRRMWLVFENERSDDKTAYGHNLAGYIDFLDLPLTQSDLLTWQS